MSSPATVSRRKGKKKDDVDGTHISNGVAQANGSFEPRSVAKPSQTERSTTKDGRASANTVTTSKTTSILQIWAPTLLLIFGGCCSNVYTLEALIQASPSSGPLITAFQFLMVALATAPRHLSFSRGWRNLYLRERAIPLRRWIVYTAYFLSINILNNMAFKYQISIPLHIILRSAGPVTTMAVGRLWGGKRYPVQKVVAVVLLFVGVVVAAISDAWSKQQQQPHYNASISATELEVEAAEEAEAYLSSTDTSAISSQAPGFALLASALVLSACMGLYADDMYATYGRSGDITAETLFYSHAMSLPFFASQAKSLMQDLASLASIHQGPNTSIVDTNHGTQKFLSSSSSSFSWLASTTTTTQENHSTTSSNTCSPTNANLNLSLAWTTMTGLFLPLFGNKSPVGTGDTTTTTFSFPCIANQIPRPVFLLLLNATTQLLCIVGVNRLSAQSSSLTVSIVLNIRKLASLVLSIWLFGNTLPSGVLLGAVVVFVGGGLYALPTTSGAKSGAKSGARTGAGLGDRSDKKNQSENQNEKHTQQLELGGKQKKTKKKQV
ncbi:hypothetical protein KCU88_g7011, partial [Aureobasidium melanogenum]